MEQYGKILGIAMPIFLLLIVVEKVYGHFKGVDHVPVMDSVSSISSGITNAVKDVLGLSVSLISYEWLLSKMAVFSLQATAITYIIAFFVIDFYGYWTHRWAHQINFFWNKHAIHHSSEEFNLACALRQTVSSFVNLFTFLLIPAAIIGVPTDVIAITLPIQLFLQFWYHTRYINKMGVLEKIVVTPSHHRVHHAINPEYLDKNHSQIFIFWDKLFGTFQEELPEVPAVFGITRPAETWNPIKINYQHLWLMVRDAWYAENWKDKFRIWFMPTGWRPENFELKYPVHKIKDVFDFEKYGKHNSKSLIAWSVIQMLLTLLLVSYLFNNIANIGLSSIFVYGLFIFVTIYSYTELMDKNRYFFIWESIRFLFGLGVLFFYGDWFGLNSLLPFGNYLILGYLFLCLSVCAYFISVPLKLENKKVLMIKDE
jgi:alkylglycerol monooxygenase